MPFEIERKFLVVGEQWRTLGEGVPYRQGYLTTQPDRTVRIRLAGNQGYITIKGATEGICRREYEYAIPQAEAEELLDQLCDRPLIEKVRYRIQWGDRLWEVDEFFGENEGLIMAEVELSDPEQSVEIPDWIGKEVSDDPRYFNAYLMRHPYKTWALVE